MAGSAFKPSIRRTTLAAAIALSGAMAITAPATAGAATEGTSNTIMFAASSVRLDQTHRLLTLTAPTTVTLR